MNISSSCTIALLGPSLLREQHRRDELGIRSNGLCSRHFVLYSCLVSYKWMSPESTIDIEECFEGCILYGVPGRKGVLVGIPHHKWTCTKITISFERMFTNQLSRRHSPMYTLLFLGIPMKNTTLNVLVCSGCCFSNQNKKNWSRGGFATNAKIHSEDATALFEVEKIANHPFRANVGAKPPKWSFSPKHQNYAWGSDLRKCSAQRCEFQRERNCLLLASVIFPLIMPSFQDRAQFLRLRATPPTRERSFLLYVTRKTLTCLNPSLFRCLCPPSVSYCSNRFSILFTTRNGVTSHPFISQTSLQHVLSFSALSAFSHHVSSVVWSHRRMVLIWGSINWWVMDWITDWLSSTLIWLEGGVDLWVDQLMKNILNNGFVLINYDLIDFSPGEQWNNFFEPETWTVLTAYMLRCQGCGYQVRNFRGISITRFNTQMRSK